MIGEIVRREAQDSVILGQAKKFLPVEIGEMKSCDAGDLAGIGIGYAASTEQIERADCIGGADGWRMREQRINSSNLNVANCAALSARRLTIGAPFFFDRAGHPFRHRIRYGSAPDSEL